MFHALLERFRPGLQFRFENRVSAAIALADAIKHSDLGINNEESLILGIPRGGIVTADIVAEKLRIYNLNVIIPRKLTDPTNKEQSIGSIMEDGTKILDNNLIADLMISSEYLKLEIDSQLSEILRRKSLYYTEGTTYKLYSNILKFKTIILVDDGAATGYTIMVAANWIRSMERMYGHPQKRLIIALPLIPKNILNRINSAPDLEIVSLLKPSPTAFRSVEQYYKYFEPVNDDFVIEILRRRTSVGKNFD